MSNNLRKIFTQRKKLWKVYRKIRNLISRTTQKKGIEFGPTQRPHAPALSLAESGLRMKELHLQPMTGQPATRNRVGTGLSFENGFTLKTQWFYAIFDGFRPEFNFQFTTHKNRKEKHHNLVIEHKREPDVFHEKTTWIHESIFKRKLLFSMIIVFLIVW